MSSIGKLLSLVLISLIWFTIGWFMHGTTVKDHAPTALAPAQARVAKAQTLLRAHQLRMNGVITESLVADMLGEAAIDGMLRWSQDGNADLYGPAAAARYETDVKGLTGVPGYLFDIFDEQMIVTEVLPNSSAESVGLQVGDVLVRADGVVFDETNIGNEASFLQRGPIGSILNLEVKRGTETLSFQIERQKQQFVRGQVYSGQIGYLDLHLFVSGIEEQVKQELENLLAQDIRGFIWDLRGNDGGSVDTTRAILSYFIPEGVLYIVEFSDGKQKTFEANGDAFFPPMPIVLLVDSLTNSSAEIATAAMIERDQAVAIGKTTSGKGTIQDTVPLDENYLLHYTIARWLTPSYQSIDHMGITPTITIEDDPQTPRDEMLDAAIEYLQRKRQQ